MTADRNVRLWSVVVQHARHEPIAVRHVCSAAMSIAGVDTAAVTVAVSASPRETVYAADELASDLEELTLTLGEGPGVDAGAGIPVLVADLATKDSMRRWPVFAPAATDAGARAVFAFPLQMGAIHLGVLDLYRGRPGGLDRDRLADALVLADTACTVLLDAAQRELSQPYARRSEPFLARHAEVHQATGMVSVQLGVSVALALVRLRAYAYAHDRRLSDVARDVVGRRLRFEPDTGREGR